MILVRPGRSATAGMLWLLFAGCSLSAPEPREFAIPSGADDEINSPLRETVASDLPSLVALYQWFHAHAELSRKEERTAARFAGELREAGWEVTEKLAGHGVVAVLRNGPGPTVLVRVDLDGLPVQEETGLPYASVTEGVMHACGHDTHLAIGVGTARALGKLRNRWSGSVVLVGQPSEEIGRGAMEMLDEPGFHAAVPAKPVACLSVHDFADPAGTVSICSGWASANVDDLDITVHGRGGHGAWPHETVDPIVVAAEIIQGLQTIVSRKIAPGTKAVVTVGSIHGGTKHNIIPNEVKLQLTVRSFEDDVRARLLGAIDQVAVKTGEAHRVPRPVEVKNRSFYTPAGFNDPALCERLRAVFGLLLGPSNVLSGDPMMGGEDFSRFPKHYGVPGLQIRVGAVEPALFRSGRPVPALHSGRWAPDPVPTVRTGTLALSRACLELLGRRWGNSE